jgi:hypothetical protein
LTEDVAAVRSPATDPRYIGHHNDQINTRILDRSSPGPANMTSDIAQATQRLDFAHGEASEVVERPSRILSHPSIQRLKERPGPTEARPAAEFRISPPAQVLKKPSNPAFWERRTSAATRTSIRPVPEAEDGKASNADGSSPQWQLHARSGRYYKFIENGMKPSLTET